MGAGTKHPASGILILARLRKQNKLSCWLQPVSWRLRPLLSPVSLPRLSSWMPGSPPHGADHP